MKTMKMEKGAGARETFEAAMTIAMVIRETPAAYGFEVQWYSYDTHEAIYALGENTMIYVVTDCYVHDIEQVVFIYDDRTILCTHEAGEYYYQLQVA